MIAIIGAMSVEVEILLKNMVNPEKVIVHGREFYKGKINGKDVVVAQCGIGKVAAAVCAQTLIDLFKVECIINTGIAGGINENLKIGDIVVSTYAVQHDFNITNFGYARGYMCTSDDKDSATKYQADKKLLKIVTENAKKTLKENNVHQGVIATGDLFVASGKTKQKIKDEFNAYAAEMEGGAIAQTCYLNQTPFVIIRAISDLADGSASENYEKFETQAAFNCANLVMSCLEDM